MAEIKEAAPKGAAPKGVKPSVAEPESSGGVFSASRSAIVRYEVEVAAGGSDDDTVDPDGWSLEFRMWVGDFLAASFEVVDPADYTVEAWTDLATGVSTLMLPDNMDYCIRLAEDGYEFSADQASNGQGGVVTWYAPRDIVGPLLQKAISEAVGAQLPFAEK